VLSIGFYNKLEVTQYIITDNRIPSRFDGYTIVQLSDFHCKRFGNQEEELINEIKNEKPNLIVLTGDLIDRNHQDIENVSILLNGISQICPVYTISGNHEFDEWNQYIKLVELYKKYGIVQLDDSTQTISIGNDNINVHGLKWGSTLTNQIIDDAQTYDILLYHNANEFNHMSTLGYQLILSGHTHGGLIRLPFFNGLIGNNGDLLPAFAGGVFVNHDCTMISSRGLGDSYLPRFLNRPELVSITLKSSKQ
jgi:predicted MPP superfamily phosphohydrolase